ncbi:MAG TPA: hypothetical protein VK400_04950 [Pyrinomonadaceae bacterium]|nr:hypothetical protein [Pyrinomonadaceae bacterium]
MIKVKCVKPFGAMANFDLFDARAAAKVCRAATKIVFRLNTPEYGGELDKAGSKTRIKNCFSRKSFYEREGDVAERLKAAVC